MIEVGKAPEETQVRRPASYFLSDGVAASVWGDWGASESEAATFRRWRTISASVVDTGHQVRVPSRSRTGPG